MAEQKRRGAVDENGYDWNSGEEFAPTTDRYTGRPYQRAAAQTPVATAQPAQQQAAPQQAQAQPQTTAAGGYSPAASSLPYSLSALQSQAASVAANNRIPRVSTAEQERRLDDWRDAATEQANAQIDRGVTQGVNEYARAREEAYQRYQSQLNQIDADEAKAKDNQSLYAAARGDRGGIGAEQYNSIMNAAMQNRVTVNNARNKMATDISRAIAELRANGEFQKANAALDVTQQYLQQLMQLEQWAMTTNISIDQYNASLDQWALNYNQQLAQLGLQREEFEWQRQTDERNYNRSVYESDRAYQYQQERDAIEDAYRDKVYDRNVFESDRNYNRGVYESDRNYDFTQRQYADTLKQREYENSITERQLRVQEQQRLASEAWTAINNGVALTDEEHLRALGITREEAIDRASIARAKEALGIESAQLSVESAKLGIEGAKLSNEGARISNQAAQAQLDALTGGGSGGVSFGDATTRLFEDAKVSGNPQSYITNNYKKYGLSSSSGLYNDYKNWLSGAISGGMSYENARKEADAGIWSDAIYNGLTSGGMTLADIVRVYSDGDEESGYTYSERFRDFMGTKVGSGSGNSNYGNIKSMINTVLNGNNSSQESKIPAIQKYVNQIWDRLSTEQRLDLINLLNRHNIDFNF